MENQLKAANILSDDFDSTIIKINHLNLLDSDEKVLAFTLENVFSERECQQLIEFSEKREYCPALINVGGEDKLHNDVRKNSRFLFDDEEFVSILWSRISSFIPKTFKGHKVVGINNRLRFLRYDPGDYFRPHYDGVYVKPDGSELSLITLQIYLNEGFIGGETNFLKEKSDEKLSIIPKTGMILVFDHSVFHEGALLVDGRKYTIRTDVMFKNLKI